MNKEIEEEIEGDLRTVLKPYLGHWDIPEGQDLILTIDRVLKETVKNQRGEEIKPVIHFMEPGVKPMVCNKVNNLSIIKALGTSRAKNWHGKKIALYEADESHSEDGKAIRVREYPPKTEEYYCEECGELITDAVANGKTYKAKVIANNALTKFGKYLCYDCAQKAKEAETESEAKTQ